MKEIKQFLENTFDHKTLVAADDPHMESFLKLEELKVIDMITVPAVGCEAFSGFIFQAVNDWVSKNYADGRVKLMIVEVREHGGNSAYARRSRNV